MTQFLELSSVIPFTPDVTVTPSWCGFPSFVCDGKVDIRIEEVFMVHILLFILNISQSVKQITQPQLNQSELTKSNWTQAIPFQTDPPQPMPNNSEPSQPDPAQPSPIQTILSWAELT
jgi:hypothetical protein